MFVFVLALCLIHLTSCQAAILHKRVVGGTLIRKGSHPFLVSLWFMKENPYTNNTKMHHVCGGSLIGSRWVLSAAHCFNGNNKRFPGLDNKELWKVVVAKHNQLKEESTNQIRMIEEIFMNPNWNETSLAGDAVLLKLTEPVDLTREGAELIETDTSDTCAVPGADCYVVGWGQVISSPYGYGMYVPVKADMPIVNNSICSEDYGGMHLNVDETSLCVGYSDGRKSACYGDSGGPLVCRCNDKDVVAGIASYGFGCGEYIEYPHVVYARVSSLQEWKNQTIISETLKTTNSYGSQSVITSTPQIPIS